MKGANGSALGKEDEDDGGSEVGVGRAVAGLGLRIPPPPPPLSAPALSNLIDDDDASPSSVYVMKSERGTFQIRMMRERATPFC